MLNIPSRKLAPNQQVNHFFLHILKISTGAFEPGANLSSAEQDASFQEMHEDKSRYNSKQAGDGFLIDSFCESEYTMKFYPCKNFASSICRFRVKRYGIWCSYVQR